MTDDEILAETDQHVKDWETISDLYSGRPAGMASHELQVRVAFLEQTLQDLMTRLNALEATQASAPEAARSPSEAWARPRDAQGHFIKP